MTDDQRSNLLYAIEYIRLAEGRSDSDNKILHIGCMKIIAVIDDEQPAPPKSSWETYGWRFVRCIRPFLPQLRIEDSQIFRLPLQIDSDGPRDHDGKWL